MIIIYVLNYERKTKKSSILTILKRFRREGSITKEISFKNYIKQNISLNEFILIIFIFLICILNLIRVSIFVGTDPWLHIFIIKKIAELNYIPSSDYLGAMGLQIFGAVIHFFSNIDFLIIPRYFIFYTFPLSVLIIYNLFMRIFKNKNLAILGVFILEFSSLGFSLMMYQFWPAGLAFLLCLFAFFLMYVRFQYFIKEERPSRKTILSEMFFYYFLIIGVFISSLLTHSLTTVIFFTSLFPVYFIYFLKDYKRGFDFLLLCVLFIIIFIFFVLDLSIGHLRVLRSIELIPWNYIFLGVILGGLITGLLIWRIRKSLLFTRGRFNSAIIGKKSMKYKNVEDKIIIPLALTVIAFSTVIFFLVNTILFKLDITFIFMVFQLL
ncbi:MAG: hypothetical protein ACFFDN_52190, partial [Candidatus Hodarchaeota archaeon]